MTSFIVYFSWTAVVSAGLGLMTGTAGFAACFIFIRSIYSAIKVNEIVYILD
jgi:transmembrane 9 superfamily member 2/4